MQNDDVMWVPKPGDLIQCWDTNEDDDGSRILEHGKLGYVVGLTKRTDTFKDSRGKQQKLSHIEEGTCFKCIFFDNPMKGEIVHVNRAWIRRVNKSSDIRQV